MLEKYPVITDKDEYKVIIDIVALPSRQVRKIALVHIRKMIIDNER